MGSSVVIYVVNFVKIGLGIQKIIRGIKTHTDSNVIP
jgi:hypothetical protein